MSPLYIKMRPEDNVTVDMRDLTNSESLIKLDYGMCASNSRADSSGSALEYVVQHNIVPEHENDEDSHQPTSSNELHDNTEKDSDLNGVCNPETSLYSTKTHSITDTSENENKYSDIVEHCDISQIESSKRECADLNLSVLQNITACNVQSPDSSTTVDSITKLPDKQEKLVLNKGKSGGVRKPKAKSKFDIQNFVKSKVSNKSTVVQKISGNKTENTQTNIDSEKEMCNLKNQTTKSKRNVRKVRYPTVKEPSTIESKTKLPNEEQNKLEDTKQRRTKRVTKSILKPKVNLDKIEDPVSEESRSEHVTDTKRKSSLEDVEYPEDTHTGHSRTKSKSKLKHKLNSIESDKPIEPTVPVNVMNAIDKKNKKNNKPAVEENRRNKKKTEPQLMERMILRNHVSTKASRIHEPEDASHEEEISVIDNIKSKLPIKTSTTEVSSRLNENDMSKNNAVPKKTNKEEKIQKNVDNIHGKTKLKKKITFDENPQTAVPTEHFVVESKSKLAEKKQQSSELENFEPKLPTLPVTIRTEKLKCIPKLFEKCKTNFENKEQPAPRKEFEVAGKPKKMDEQEYSPIKNVNLSDNWNMYPLSPIAMTTETLQQRWAETGLIAPLNKDYYNELRRRRAQQACEAKLQETTQTFLFDSQNSKGQALVNPLANVSKSLTELHSSLDEHTQYEYHLPVPVTTKLPGMENIKSHETIQPTRQISFDTCKETTTANEPFVDEGIRKIMSGTEHRVSNNCTMLSRAIDVPTPFLVPCVPPRKRIRINTNIEKQTLPSKTNMDYDAYEDDKDDMEEEMQNTSEECSASNKHSFNFVDMTAIPAGMKRIQKVKITRPDMSDILTSNDNRKPLEDDSISIYAESIRNDTISVKKACGLDHKYKEIPAIHTNNIVSEWVRHSTDNATAENTNNRQIEERFRPFKHPRIDCNMFVGDEALPAISNSVEDPTGMTEYTMMPPCGSDNLDTLYIFDTVCKNVMADGICHKLKCGFQHALPRNWEIILQNMPEESLRNLYNNIKNRRNLYLFQRVFPIVVKQLVLHRDFNSVISLVKDVLEINVAPNRTPYINAIVDALRSIGMTFNSVIDVIFNSTFVARNLKAQLTDILINICLEQSAIVNSWSTIQMLLKYRNYHVDADIIKTILRKCLAKSNLQKQLCLYVYSDLISRISDDTLGTRFKYLLNDYIECMRTLGLSNEAQALYERIAPMSVQSSDRSLHMPTGSVRSKFVSEDNTMPITPLFSIKFPAPPKQSSSSTRTQIPKHNNSPPKFNAPYTRPKVNKVMPWNNKSDLLFKDVLTDKQASNVASTSATVAPHDGGIQTYGMNTVKRAIFTENVPQLMFLIRESKERDLMDEFLKTCLDAMQESMHNFAVLFRNMCQSATVLQNEQDGQMDKSLEYVFQTIGNNLIIYAANNNQWKQAYNIYQTLRHLCHNVDIKNVKMFMLRKPSYIKWLLIICRIFVKNNDCRYAWELFKVNSLHTSRCWTEESDQQDIQYRDLVFTELMTGLNTEKQWEAIFTIIEYILKHNILELDPIVDGTIQMAVRSDCHTEYIISFISVCPIWFNRIHCHTFRVIVVKLVKDNMYRMARTVYRQGCELKIYPQLFGSEKCLVFSTHYVFEELLLMLKVFLQNMVNFMPVRHTLVIRARPAPAAIVESGTALPSSLFQHNVSCETIHVRIVNILNNYIKPPIRVVNKYSQLEITPAELEKHLEARRKWNQFC